MKKNTRKYLIPCVSFLMLPALVFAQNPNPNPDLGFVSNLSNQTLSVVDGFIPLALAIAMLVFIWGLVVFISQSGNEQAKEEGKRKMIWGIIALFVIVSVWGLVALLQTLVGVGGGGAGLSAPNIPA